MGVHDETREVSEIPLERLDAVEALVRQACEDSLKPPGFPVIERISLPDSTGDERPVVRIEIPSSLFVHQSPGGCFHRVGSSKRPIPPDQLGRLFQQRSQARLIRFDETPVTNATLGDLDKALWSRFATPLTTDTPEQFSSSLAWPRRMMLEPGTLMWPEFCWPSDSLKNFSETHSFRQSHTAEPRYVQGQTERISVMPET